MLLFPLRQDFSVDFDISTGSSWLDLTSHASTMLKTTRHNHFLSLLGQDRSLRTHSMTAPLPTATAPAVDGAVRSLKRPRELEDQAHFGSKPKRQTIEEAPTEEDENAKAVAPPKTEQNHENKAQSVLKPDPDGMDIDFLIKSFSDHVVIRDRATRDSRAISLPNGFAMDSAIGPSDFYKTKGDIKKHLKRKREEKGALPKTLIRDWKDTGGFRPQEVNFSGAVSLKDCKHATLDNEIHPLLRRSRFDDTPDAIYDQLLPALRLASMFLTQPVCMQFWVTVALGERVVDEQMSLQYRKKCLCIAHHVKLTKENTTQVINHLRELGEENIIHFTFKHKLLQGKHGAGGAWATSGPICDYLGVKRSHNHKLPLTRSIIRLHADHYIIAKKLSQLTYPEVSQSLRFNFFFATLIMHELAHSIEGAYMQLRPEQWSEYQRSKTYQEPLWLNWRRPPECGKAWEATMFGGEIQPVNNRVDGSHGIGVCDWPPKGSDGDAERRIWYTVPMSYIEGLFQKSTWERKHKMEDWDAFHVPRTGATSLYCNYFTTMPYSEDRRVAHEELRELIANVTEQPPPKMRMVYGGGKEEKRLGEEEVVEKAVQEQQLQMKASEQNPGASMFGQTRRLSAVITGGLPTARGDAEADVLKGPSCRLLYEIAERSLKVSKSSGLRRKKAVANRLE